MSTIHGNDGAVLIGAANVAEVQSFEFTESARTAEDSSMGDDDVTIKPGKNEASGSLTCHYDYDDTNGQELLKAGSSVTLLLRPGGTGSGLPELSVPAIITSVGVTTEHEGIVQASFEYIRNGAHAESRQS